MNLNQHSWLMKKIPLKTYLLHKTTGIYNKSLCIINIQGNENDQES